MIGRVEAAVELRVLGPLEAISGQVRVPLGTRKQQLVLALLALDSPRVVAVDTLVDELWPEAPPPSAVPNVRSYAANLRRLFEAAGTDDAAPEIVRQRTGYALALKETSFDLHAFRTDCAAADEARRLGDLRSAVARLGAALDRWRDPTLAGLPRGPGLFSRCAGIEEQRALLESVLFTIPGALTSSGVTK